MAMKNIIGFLLLIIFLSANSEATGELLQKCCAAGEVYEIKSDECVKNINNYTLDIPSLPLDKNLEIKTVKYGSEKLQNSSSNDLKIETNRNGNLIIYDNGTNSILGIYKKFCVAINADTGEVFALILHNIWRINICNVFQPNILHAKCHPSPSQNLIEDYSKIPGLDNNLTANVEFVVVSLRDFNYYVDYEKKENVPYYFIHNGEELSIGKHNFKNYCIKKVEDKWITFIKIKLINFYSPYLEIISILFLFILIHQYFDKDLLLNLHVQLLMAYAILLVAVNLFNIIINITINNYLILFKNCVVIILCTILSLLWCEIGLKHLSANIKRTYFILLPIYALVGMLITFICYFKFPELGIFEISSKFLHN